MKKSKVQPPGTKEEYEQPEPAEQQGHVHVWEGQDEPRTEVNSSFSCVHPGNRQHFIDAKVEAL